MRLAQAMSDHEKGGGRVKLDSFPHVMSKGRGKGGPEEETTAFRVLIIHYVIAPWFHCASVCEALDVRLA